MKYEIKSLFIAKHWQIFIWIVCFPVITGVFSAFLVNGIFYLEFGAGYQNYFDFYTVLDKITLVSFILFLLWTLIFVITFSKAINLNNNLRLFKTAVVLSVIMNFAIVALERVSNEPAYEATVIAPLSLISFIILLYVYYFASKTLNKAESGSEPGKKAIIRDMILFLGYPIGIWFLQPRINRINDKNFV